MDDSHQKAAKFQYGPSGIVIEGAEEFVEALIEQLDLADLIRQGGLPSESSSGASASGAQDLSATLITAASLGSPLAEFDGVFIETDEGFSIIADVDENTIAKTARNYILLHLYGSYLLERFEVSDDDLRTLCINHACYDPGNFSQHVKGLGSKVHRVGGSRSYSLKLTAPGIRSAKRFVEETQKRAMSE